MLIWRSLRPADILAALGRPAEPRPATKAADVVRSPKGQRLALALTLPRRAK
jgi:hypothetical protein